MNLKLTDRERSKTFLTLLKAWKVAPELASSADVARHSAAKVIGLHLEDAPAILAAAECLFAADHLNTPLDLRQFFEESGAFGETLDKL